MAANGGRQSRPWGRQGRQPAGGCTVGQPPPRRHRRAVQLLSPAEAHPPCSEEDVACCMPCRYDLAMLVLLGERSPHQEKCPEVQQEDWDRMDRTKKTRVRGTRWQLNTRREELFPASALSLAHVSRRKTSLPRRTLGHDFKAAHTND